MIRAALALSLATTLANAVPATGQVTVSNAWVRGTVGGQKTSGAFMQLKSSTDVEVVGVATPAAKTAEIHASRSDGGMMRMSHVEKLQLPAGKTVDLLPGGYHVMLIDLNRPLKEGDTVPMSLTIVDNAGKTRVVEFNAPVRDLTAGPAGSDTR
jgi:copper(I)-binding protein